MTHRYIQNGSHEATEFDQEWIILNTENYTVTKLNDMGGFCWSLLSSNQTVDSLVEAVTKELDSVIPKERIEADIREFLSDLIECDLVAYDRAG
ncbi:PqqD family protein [Peribacillus kribbensis]|uniref:PqqD family protein n=1 Tax=Peribacillus kribbensis TaxID=356658 RepID=UPI000417FB21|nr:PqqD family protein [Peribacillus kribbensis]